MYLLDRSAEVVLDVDVCAGDPAVLLHHLHKVIAGGVVGVALDVLAGELGDADQRAREEQQARREAVEQLQYKVLGGSSQRDVRMEGRRLGGTPNTEVQGA